MSGRQSAVDRKAQIVAEVLRLADEIGPDRLSTTDVARAIGISQPAIFRHFSTKGALWLAVAEYIAERLQTDWAAAEARANGPRAPPRADRGAADDDIRDARPAIDPVLARVACGQSSPARGVPGLLGAFQGRLVAVIRELQASGDLCREVSPDDVAILLTSLVQGVAIRWSLGARGFPLVREGLRLFDVQLALLAAREGAYDEEPG